MLSLLIALSLDVAAQTPTSTSMDRMGPVSAEHTGGNFGMGIAVGAPTGVTGKLWLEDWTAVQFSFGGPPLMRLATSQVFADNGTRTAYDRSPSWDGRSDSLVAV